MFGRSSILGFCVLAYALTWLCWLPLLLARGGSVVLPVSQELLATLGQFGPFAAAVFCAAWDGRARGLRDLLGRLVIWRVRVLWFGVALLLPPICMGGAILVHALIQGLSFAAAMPSDLSTVLPHLAITLVIGGPLGEEPGWRGFVLPRLRARWHPIPASAVLTVIWACWHLPLWWVADVPSSFPVYLVGVLPLTYLFTWLWDHTRGSVLIALLFHASLNTSLVRMPIFPAWKEWTILIWMVAVSACIFEWARGRRGPQEFGVGAGPILSPSVSLRKCVGRP
jgi:uncharacterized protein